MTRFTLRFFNVMKRKRSPLALVAIYLLMMACNEHHEADPEMSVQQQPVPMKLTEPKPDSLPKVDTAGFHTVTFMTVRNDKVYYYAGPFQGNLQHTGLLQVGSLIAQNHRKFGREHCLFIIKSDSSATFRNTIELLDAMAKQKVPANRYVEMNLSAEEIEFLKQTIK